MSTTTLTPEVLAYNTRGADLPVGGATVATTPADGWVIPMGAYGSAARLFLLLSADATGDIITFLAGDRPPSMRSALGDLAITLAALDERPLILEAGRFIQSDGTIRATCVDAGTGIRAWFLPPALAGGSAVAGA